MARNSYIKLKIRQEKSNILKNPGSLTRIQIKTDAAHFKIDHTCHWGSGGFLTNRLPKTASGKKNCLQDPGPCIQDFLDPGPWMQDSGSRILDPGPWIQDPGSRVWEAVYFLEAVISGGGFLASGGQAVFKLTAELPGGLNIGDGYSKPHTSVMVAFDWSNHLKKRIGIGAFLYCCGA